MFCCNDIQCHTTALRRWTKSVAKSTLYDLMRYFYAAVRNLEQIYIPVKYDRIFLLKKLIKKKQPKHILSSRLYFYCVEKYGMFYPFYKEIDTERYFELMKTWRKDGNMKKILNENPGYRRRHKKIYKYKLLR